MSGGWLREGGAFWLADITVPLGIHWGWSRGAVACGRGLGGCALGDAQGWAAVWECDLGGQWGSGGGFKNTALVEAGWYRFGEPRSGCPLGAA